MNRALIAGVTLFLGVSALAAAAHAQNETNDRAMGTYGFEAGLSSRPASLDYPPCRPGPGDDRCIQLYEPVSSKGSQWGYSGEALGEDPVTNAMGGPFELRAGAATGMGGPYEPLDEGLNDVGIAMSGDGLDAEMGESGGDDLGQVEFYQHSEFAGVGGPIEAQSGYPPCSAGPGDDSCIQLYERGVTGFGN